MSDQVLTPEDWRRVRRLVDQDRRELTSLAVSLHESLPRVAGTSLLGRPRWLPAAPVPLDRVALAWSGAAPRAQVTGTGAAAAAVLPAGYTSYAEAIGALDRPALFEDRFCYRLLAADLAGPPPLAPPGQHPPRLAFGPGRYFEALSLGHAVAHELAAAAAAGGPVRLADLPLRRLAGDPCDLARRSALCAVTTLTLRRAADGTASFLLHWRDPARVNHAGGLYQVMPAGIFQPVSGTPAARRADFSLWRCMTREFHEELLGGSEDYPVGRDGVLDYGRWPFARNLAAARAAGALRVSCLGLGVDPLTLATDILCAAVFDAAAFDRLFRDLVSRNEEGRVVTEDGSAAIPFTAATVARFTGGGEPMQAAGAALLRLAWQHRDILLGWA